MNKSKTLRKNLPLSSLETKLVNRGEIDANIFSEITIFPHKNTMSSLTTYYIIDLGSQDRPRLPRITTWFYASSILIHPTHTYSNPTSHGPTEPRKWKISRKLKDSHWTGGERGKRVFVQRPMVIQERKKCQYISRSLRTGVRTRSIRQDMRWIQSQSNLDPSQTTFSYLNSAKKRQMDVEFCDVMKIWQNRQACERPKDGGDTRTSLIAHRMLLLN